MIVPTPVLAEVMVRAGNSGQAWLTTLKGRRAIRIAGFDELAAIECAALFSERSLRKNSTSRTKAKFDEQIVAIAVVENAEMILSDDADLSKLAPDGLIVQGISSLELPPEAAQSELFDQAGH